MHTATIRVFLVRGDPKRLRLAELSNWTGKAVAGPRSELADVFSRDESRKAGVYLHSGTNPKTGEATVYIGEAENIRARVKAHLDKDFWNQIVFVVSKDESLTKAHIRYLEGRLIARARGARRASVQNAQGTTAKLPEPDRAEMEVFLDKFEQLLPVLGIDFLVSADGSRAALEHQELVCAILRLRARGRRSPSGFVVLEGSQAVLRERPSTRKYPLLRQVRERLQASGALKRVGGAFVFTRDVEFSSPSAAAAVVHGGQANGLTAWRTERGESLKDIEAP